MASVATPSPAVLTRDMGATTARLRNRSAPSRTSDRTGWMVTGTPRTRRKPLREQIPRYPTFVQVRSFLCGRHIPYTHGGHMHEDVPDYCTVEAAMDVVGGKW